MLDLNTFFWQMTSRFLCEEPVTFRLPPLQRVNIGPYAKIAASRLSLFRELLPWLGSTRARRQSHSRPGGDARANRPR